MRAFNLISIVMLLLTGCMVGPDFHRPAPPPAHRYTDKTLPKKTVSTPQAPHGGTAQAFVYRKSIPQDWWKLFHSPTLNKLVLVGLQNSPTLDVAEATLRQAQEAYRVQFGNTMLPAFTGTFSGVRGNSSGSTSLSNGITVSTPTIFNLYNLNLDVAYTFDIWGGARRQLEALCAQVDYQSYQLAGSYLTLTSNISTMAIQVASLSDQIKATTLLLKAEEDVLRIMHIQLKLGGIAGPEVFTQETLVNQTRATIPSLQKKLAQSQHALLVLMGQYTDKSIPSLTLSDFTLPDTLPVSLPSELMRQRPDIQASEALLHAANAQVGVATANLFPQLTIIADYGRTSSLLPTLLNSANKAWDVGAQITAPLFNGGALTAARRQAIAAYEAAHAQYRQTVLQSFKNVADVLNAIETDARNFHALKIAEISAAKNLSITKQQYKLGGISYLSLLNAEQQYQQVLLNRIQAEETRFTDTIALYQALGGGWWRGKI